MAILVTTRLYWYLEDDSRWFKYLDNHEILRLTIDQNYPLRPF